jgi:HMG (high mobility group) box
MNLAHADKSNPRETSPNQRQGKKTGGRSPILDVGTVDNDFPTPLNQGTQVTTVKDNKTNISATLTHDNTIRSKPKFGKRWTWKKPQGKPCRPLSAYNLFFADMRQTLIKEKISSDGIGFSNLARTVSLKWRTTPDSEREKFDVKAKILKAQYMLELQKWESEQQSTANAHLSANGSGFEQKKQRKRPCINKPKPIINDDNDESVDIKTQAIPRISKVNSLHFTPDSVASNHPDRISFNHTDTTNIAIEMTELQRGIAVVTEAFTELGKSVALKLASFPFVDVVLAISKSIPYRDFTMSNKIRPLAVDISTLEGKHIVVEHVRLLCEVRPRRRQVRFLIHCPVAYGPIRSALSIQHDELRHAMALHCESPLLLISSLYSYLEPDEDTGIAGRVLHILNHENKRAYGICVEGLALAALFQAYQDMAKEFHHVKGGHVIVGSCKVVAVTPKTNGVEEAVHLIDSPYRLKETPESVSDQGISLAKRVSKAPDSNMRYSLKGTANFVEHLLLGTSDKEFSNSGFPHLYTTEDDRK